MNRFKVVLGILQNVHDEKGSVRVADLGGTPDYWQLVKDEILKLKVTVDVVNLKNSDHQSEPHIRVFTGDVTSLADFDDQSYDLVHSNSTIEHVGDWNQMKKMAQEVQRLAPRHFIQTPNFWFPMEPHFMLPFVHWLPEQLRISKFRKRAISHYSQARNVDEAMEIIQSVRLLNEQQLTALFPDSKILRERFFGLTKSLMAVRF